MYTVEIKFFTALVFFLVQIKLILIGLLITWSISLGPSRAMALEADDARHLLARTGFGLPRPDEIAALKELNRAEAVEHILNAIKTEAATAPPSWVKKPMPAWKVRQTWTEFRTRNFNKRNRFRWRELQGWWVSEMLKTPAPITERLVLFWHNHFTSSFDGVKWVPLLYQQNVTFRRHAAGNFRELLGRMITDPAMLFYLDGRRNRAKKPNENFARELLELFTMGEDEGYMELDIRETARALSGWGVDLKTLKPIFIKKHHDNGEKVLFGQSGRFNSNDVLKIILDHSRPAIYIAERFYNEFIGGTPHASTIAAAAKVFRNSNYSVRALLRLLLNSRVFWAAETRGCQIKSPVDMVVGLARFSGWQGDVKILTQQMNGMGQKLFRPPNARGWPGGAAWISSISLRKRNNFVATITKPLRRDDLFAAEKMGRIESDMGSLMLETEWSPKAIQAVLLAVPTVRNLSLDRLSPAAQLTALLHDPAFQMK